ncbi:MAG: hypothetical protein U0359_39620 [Byssovorax sp.]
MGPRVQRQDHPPPAASPAPGYTDEQLLQIVESSPDAHFAGLWHNFGGLHAIKKQYPRTYEVVRARAISAFGGAAYRFAYENDARILALCQSSALLTSRVDALKNRFADNQQWIALSTLTENAGQFEFSYFVAFQGYKKAGSISLGIWEAYLSGDVAQVAAALQARAEEAQTAADERERLRERRELAGMARVGAKAAKIEGIFWDTDVFFGKPLRPRDGEDTEVKALAWARIAGVATAVSKVGDRYYVYQLSRNFSYDERTAVVPAGGAALSIITREGYVGRPQGERFFGAKMTGDPEAQLAGSLSVAEDRASSLDGDDLFALFRKVALDVALANLDAAEKRLRSERGRIKPAGRADPMIGWQLRADAASLRSLMLRASRLGSQIGGKDPSDDDIEETRTTLEAIGRIMATNPAAAMMVKNEHDRDDKGPAKDDEIKNRLAGKTSEEAIDEASGEINERLAHVEKIRSYFYEHPDEPSKIAVLRAMILPRFPAEQRGAIENAIFWDELATMAKALGIFVLEFAALIGGIMAGGLPALLVGLGMSAAGLVGVVDAFENAGRLEAMSRLDVEGGFQLADPESASSARRWAFVALALSALDLGLLGHGLSSASRLRGLVASAEASAAIRMSGKTTEEIAGKLGMTERELLNALRVARGAERATLLSRIRALGGARSAGTAAGVERAALEDAQVLRVGEHEISVVGDSFGRCSLFCSRWRMLFQSELDDYPMLNRWLRQLEGELAAGRARLAGQELTAFHRKLTERGLPLYTRLEQVQKVRAMADAELGEALQGAPRWSSMFEDLSFERARRLGSTLSHPEFVRLTTPSVTVGRASRTLGSVDIEDLIANFPRPLNKAEADAIRRAAQSPQGLWALDVGGFPQLRGEVAHVLLGENLPRTFATVDRVVATDARGVATEVRSIKTHQPYVFADDARFYATLKEDVDALVGMKEGRHQLAATRIRVDSTTARVLEVGVPPGTMGSPGAIEAGGTALRASDFRRIAASIVEYGQQRNVKVLFKVVQ